MPRLAGRFAAFPRYPLADVPEIKRKLKADGVDVIDLGAGDADLPPPPAAVAALQTSVGVTEMSRYPFQLGLHAFRTAVVAWMEKRFGVRLDPLTEMLPLIGSKEGIAHVAFAFLDAGDVTIVPDPGYQCYMGGTLLAGGEPYLVPLRAEHDFLIPLEDIPGDVARRARILYLNYPNNPTTAVAPRAYLEDAVRWCRERDVLLVYDNAYSELAFDGYRPPSILEIEGAREVALEFHSLSKTYNMTGWRIGWVAGSAPLVSALARVKTFVDTGASLLVQAGAQAALAGYDDWVPQNIERFRERRDAAATALREAGFQVTVPRATMYLWLPIPGAEPRPSAEEFARRALAEQGVVLMPGSALGAGGEGFVRVALTQPRQRLVEAARRLGRLL
jgi:LL-diaminopimelate aminotransferase